MVSNSPMCLCFSLVLCLILNCMIREGVPSKFKQGYSF
ncbi:hypothetical protein TorRG33x02_190970 [Trema orientale]|uniref:Uncharacterized protein n=1 Tax=Trema orientale TaxID=63057 RepID=A0A2P5EHY2_TREOI|nr:hypothetical protein TorRG33x02_190970 [Trema orientale]